MLVNKLVKFELKAKHIYIYIFIFLEKKKEKTDMYCILDLHFTV